MGVEIVFWGFLFLVLHTYLIYPLLMRGLMRIVTTVECVHTPNEPLPFLSILLAVHNEDKVLQSKLQSIFSTTYPHDRFELLIGSDLSTDQTNILLENNVARYGYRYTCFSNRMGKPNIINRLAEQAKGDVLILTDANVLFEKNTLFELAKHFKDEKIGLVDSNMINTGKLRYGISIQESTYISMEVGTKQAESKLFGAMMGPFGGCYAIRKGLYQQVPHTYLVDDFYLNMKVLEQGYKTINELSAIVFEDVSNLSSEEFRRKVRIATGNFQNMATFAHWLLNPFSAKTFCYLSHKVLRWLTPFFLAILFLLSPILFSLNPFYFYLFCGQCIGYSLPFWDFLLRKTGIHIVPLRFVTHFIAMNVAIFWGFVKYLKGVESNVWRPTQRNQQVG